VLAVIVGLSVSVEVPLEPAILAATALATTEPVEVEDELELTILISRAAGEVDAEAPGVEEVVSKADVVDTIVEVMVVVAVAVLVVVSVTVLATGEEETEPSSTGSDATSLIM